VGALTASLMASFVLHHYGRKIPLMVSIVADLVTRLYNFAMFRTNKLECFFTLI
jgi:hypothetical protein